MEGLGVEKRRQLSLLARPDPKYNGEDTRPWEHGNSWGWTYGSVWQFYLETDYDLDFSGTLYQSQASLTRVTQTTLHRRPSLCSQVGLFPRILEVDWSAQSNCGMRGEWHPLSYLNFIFIFIFREHKVVLDGDSLTSKSAVLRQLTKQTRWGVLMADGVSKKVDIYLFICCWKFFTLYKSYNRTGSILWTKEWKPSLQRGTGRERYLWRSWVPRWMAETLAWDKK